MEITQEQEEEFRKCKEDPVYFMSNYIKVIHPLRGLVKFKMYPFQIKIVRDLQKHRFNILRKFRQAGCTTTGSGYCLHKALFEDHQSIVILSMGDTEATEVLERIKLMYDELPDFLKPGIKDNNKHTLRLATGSVIKSRASGKQSGRSLAGSFLMIDEAAFIENIDTIWAAVYPIISTGGQVFVLSTVNGLGNWYQETYTEASNGENSFNAMDIYWEQHPEYKRQEEGFDWLYEELEAKGINVDDWERTTRSNMPVKKWLQEYEASFLGTGDTYIEGEILKEITSNISKDFFIKYNNKMRVWEEPLDDCTYILAVDCALGRDRDNSAFQIINANTGNQAAEFYSNKTPINEFAVIIKDEAMLYNVAHVIPERNTIGNNLIDWLYNILEYDNLWLDDKGEIGFQTATKNRDILLANMEEAIRMGEIKINSERTLIELNTFILLPGGRVAADKGKHDDLVMSLALANLGMKDVRDSGHIDFVSYIPHKEAPPLPSQQYRVKLGTNGGITEEDYKWIMDN